MTFNVIELRRYTVHPETRADFAAYFDTYFPEAFQQLGAMILGQFTERGDPARFTWLRAFASYEERRTVNELFYRGPVWKEHRDTMNTRMLDHTDVLLLQPVHGGLDAPPVVDAVTGSPGAPLTLCIVRGRPGPTAFPDGILLETLDRENNFPPLPFRSDGPYTVWIGRGEPPFEGITLDPTRRSRLR